MRIRRASHKVGTAESKVEWGKENTRIFKLGNVLFYLLTVRKNILQVNVLNRKLQGKYKLSPLVLIQKYNKLMQNVSSHRWKIH